MCLQCAMWLCTPESTETQTQKKHTNRYMIHACGNTEKHTCSDKAGSLAVQWIVVTMALVTDDAATVHKDSESGADLWLLRYNIKTIPSGSDTATSKHGHSYETRHISHLLLPDGEVRGASCPKLFVLLLIFWAKNMPDLAIKKWFIDTQHTQIHKNNHNSFLRYTCLRGLTTSITDDQKLLFRSRVAPFVIFVATRLRR